MARRDTSPVVGRMFGLHRILLRILRNFAIWLLVFVLFGAVAGMLWLDSTVRERFGALLWEVPVHVYSRPFEIYPGLAVAQSQLQRRLDSLGYRRVSSASESGQYAVGNSSLLLVTREFMFWDGPQKSRPVRLQFSGSTISAMEDLQSRESIDVLRLKPHLLGSLTRTQHEDRIVLSLTEMPKLLLATLAAVEDKTFDRHIGIDFRGIIRSFWVNLKAGRIVQGGSTLSQQLIKNVYDIRERTYKRKLLEIAMALFLEFRFEKHQILEIYCNEVFLGQDGNRAIHGFGLASQFYFGRPVAELSGDEIALLVGMIKAPSALNPRRSPQEALKRRQIVLQIMLNERLISEEEFKNFWSAPIRLTAAGRIPDLDHGREFSTFLDTVSSKIYGRIDADELRRGHFSVFTTMDIVVQRASERALYKQLAEIESERGLSRGALQGVVVVLRPDTGEVLAMVGGRNSVSGGFNRAALARRPIGSLIKPLVYLTAFEQDRGRTLATIVPDIAITHRLEDGKTTWSPKNYDGEFHGDVTTIEALANSYNAAAVWLGLKIGVDNVAKRLEGFGSLSGVPDYPSLLLGAVELTPMEVAQVYQALANYGFRLPLQTIAAVASESTSMLGSVRAESRQVASRDAIYLTVAGMQEVLASGTGASVSNRFAAELGLAGKTGTTDNYRDSWFAGFSGNYVAVVWVGKDNNQPTGLTGATGALRVWSAVMQELNLQRVISSPQSPVESVRIDLDSGKRASSSCERVLEIPFLRSTAPEQYADC